MFNTSYGAKLAGCSKKLFGRLDSIARQSGLVERRSKKFSAAGFVLASLKAVVSGKGSLSQLTMNLAPSEMKAMSPQAMWKRLDEKATVFMSNVVGDAMSQRWCRMRDLVPCGRFGRVVIEDSSQSKLPKENAETFPGHGNDKGRTAGCKFDLAFDLLSGQVISNTLHVATEQDRVIGKDVVGLVQKNDLYLRDMGYFSIAEFQYIEQRAAFWLSRLPANVTGCDLKGRKLETRLGSSKSKRLEIDVRIGDAAHRVRLVAVKADPKIAQQRRRQRREKARSKGKTPSKNALLRDGWHLIITNVPQDRMNAKDLFALYGVRWQIEITFRAWKQSAGLVKALKRRSNQQHLEVLMYAAMLHLVLTLHVAALLQYACRQKMLSLEKIAHDLAAFLLRIDSLDGQFCTYAPDLRHIQMDRRTRKSLRETALATLG
jgi:hypothetical protein